MRLTAFTWGYWGWGSHTQEFVRIVDAVERNRGMKPPIFADIRFSRSVRAPGFRGTAFEEAVGKSRYRWLPKLGNARIGSGSGGVDIADPSGADDLLQLVSDAATDRRRVIFFCACERPCACHRAIAARLLVKSACRNRKAPTVIEWPGGEPETIEIKVSDNTVQSVLRGATRVPLGALPGRTIRRFASLPWGSRVGLNSRGHNVAVVSGPVQISSEWYLPIIGPDFSRPSDTIKSLRKEAERKRKTLGYSAATG